MPLKLEPFEKAVDSLEAGLTAFKKFSSSEKSVEREMMRDGAIQRFEYTLELSWKMLKRYLEEFGLEKVDGMSNRDLFRIGFEQGLVRDAEAWLNYLTNRNLTSHTYVEAAAERVFQNCETFLTDAQFLLARLKEKTGA